LSEYFSSKAGRPTPERSDLLS